MADDTTVVNDPGFEPEPVPDNLADIELNGLNPGDESTDSEQVEAEQGETTEEPAEAADASEADSTEESDANTTEEAAAPTDQQQQTEELTGAARRLAQKAQRDYVNEQRQQIRQYQESNDMNDVEERMRVLEAQQYIDTVERNRRDAVNDYQRATSEIPFFKQDTPQAQLALQTAIQQFNDSYAVVDPETGEYLGAQDRMGNPVSLYQYLANEGARFEAVLQNTQAEAQRSAQKSEAKMRAKAVNPTNPGKVTSSGDELDDLLAKVGDIPLN